MLKQPQKLILNKIHHIISDKHFLEPLWLTALVLLHKSSLKHMQVS